MYLLFLHQPQQPPAPPPAPIQRRRRRHNMWVRPWLLQREERGAYHNIMAELYATDIPGDCRLIGGAADGGPDRSPAREAK